MIELIPLKQDSLLVCRKSKLNILKLMLGIVNESIEACEAFLNKKYVAFDGQVGDTSCQIRAYKISLLAHNQQFITKIQNLVLQIFDYKNNLINQIQIFETYIQTHPKYFKELDQKESKEIFFNKLRAVLPIDEDCLFIILSYFLNKYCQLDGNSIPCAIDYNSIKKSLGLGSTPAHKLANYYQIFLSKLSCDFILQQSTYSNEKNVNNNLLRKLIKIGDEKRQILPYYYGTKILLSSKNTVAIPIILSLDNGTQYSPQILFFKKNYITNEIMIHSEPNDIDKHTPAVVFQGNGSENLSFNDFKNRILQVGVQNIILLNAASHPQYAGEILRNYVTDPYKDIVLTNKELKEVIVLNNEELSKARVESETIGCCINNPNLFYIKHIFCSTFFDEQNILRRKSLCLKQK